MLFAGKTVAAKTLRTATVTPVASGFLLLAAFAAISVGIFTAWKMSQDWIEHYTREHVVKKAAGMGSTVALGVFGGSLLLMTLFGAPFYKVAPISFIYDLAAKYLSAPKPTATMPDMRGMYFYLHALIAGAISAGAVMSVAGSVSASLARNLKRTTAMNRTPPLR